MNINQTTPNFQARMNVPPKKLIPLAEYKGPILKLTEAEQLQIKEIESNISNLRETLAKHKRKIRHMGALSDAYKQMNKRKTETLENEIRRLLASILDIKINRLNIQKEDFNKKLNVLV